MTTIKQDRKRQAEAVNPFLQKGQAGDPAVRGTILAPRPLWAACPTGLDGWPPCPGCDLHGVCRDASAVLVTGWRRSWEAGLGPGGLQGVWVAWKIGLGEGYASNITPACGSHIVGTSLGFLRAAAHDRAEGRGQ